MSASKRGAGQRQLSSGFRRFIAFAAAALIADIRDAISKVKVRGAQKRRMINLRGLDNRALRDIGLIRDRFTGTVLNEASGEVLDQETRQEDDITSAAPGAFGPFNLNRIERRQADRRGPERRLACRSNAGMDDSHPWQSYSAQDRRAFERRTSGHRVIDCRRLFSGRPQFLLA